MTFDPARAFDAFEEAFVAGKRNDADAALAHILEPALASDEARDATYAEAVRRLAHDHPGVAAGCALCAGSLVENGADAAPLALGLREPLVRTLEAAVPFFARALQYPTAPRANDEDNSGDDVVYVGHHAIRGAHYAQLRTGDKTGAIAFDSLETWYMPVACAWTRHRASLLRAKHDPHLRDLLDVVGPSLPFVRNLVRASLDSPFVVLVPELREGFSVLLDGVTDTGQLSVLLAHAIAPTLARIGVASAPSDEIVDVMRGDGPQQADATWGCNFHLYPWQAFDPSTKLPADERFTWLAPGGSGTHSLPSDFIPDDIVPLPHPKTTSAMMRVLLLVGPKAPNTARFTRILPATRTFDKLKARVDVVHGLSVDEVSAWLDTIAAALERA